MISIFLLFVLLLVDGVSAIIPTVHRMIAFDTSQSPPVPVADIQSVVNPVIPYSSSFTIGALISVASSASYLCFAVNGVKVGSEYVSVGTAKQWYYITGPFTPSDGEPPAFVNSLTKTTHQVAVYTASCASCIGCPGYSISSGGRFFTLAPAPSPPTTAVSTIVELKLYDTSGLMPVFRKSFRAGVDYGVTTIDSYSISVEAPVPGFPSGAGTICFTAGEVVAVSSASRLIDGTYPYFLAGDLKPWRPSKPGPGQISASQYSSVNCLGSVVSRLSFSFIYTNTASILRYVVFSSGDRADNLAVKRILAIPAWDESLQVPAIRIVNDELYFSIQIQTDFTFYQLALEEAQSEVSYTFTNNQAPPYITPVLTTLVSRLITYNVITRWSNAVSPVVLTLEVDQSSRPTHQFAPVINGTTILATDQTFNNPLVVSMDTLLPLCVRFEVLAADDSVVKTTLNNVYPFRLMPEGKAFFPYANGIIKLRVGIFRYNANCAGVANRVDTYSFTYTGPTKQLIEMAYSVDENGEYKSEIQFSSVNVFGSPQMRIGYYSQSYENFGCIFLSGPLDNAARITSVMGTGYYNHYTAYFNLYSTGTYTGTITIYAATTGTTCTGTIVGSRTFQYTYTETPTVITGIQVMDVTAINQLRLITGLQQPSVASIIPMFVKTLQNNDTLPLDGLVFRADVNRPVGVVCWTISGQPSIQKTSTVAQQGGYYSASTASAPIIPLAMSTLISNRTYTMSVAAYAGNACTGAASTPLQYTFSIA